MDEFSNSPILYDYNQDSNKSFNNEDTFDSDCNSNSNTEFTVKNIFDYLKQ